MLLDRDGHVARMNQLARRLLISFTLMPFRLVNGHNMPLQRNLASSFIRVRTDTLGFVDTRAVLEPLEKS